MELTEQLQAISELVLLNPWYGAAPANVLLQIVAVVRLRGALRAVSIILAVTTGAVLALVAAAYAMDPGNLWELLLRLATPPMLVLTIGLHLLGMVVRPREVRRPSSSYTPYYI